MYRKLHKKAVAQAHRWRIHNWHKHPFFIPVSVFLVLFFGTIAVLILTNGRPVQPSDSRTIIFSHDKIIETVPTRAATVGEFLSRAGVTLHEGDTVEPEADTEIGVDNFHINVYRAEPVLIIDGNQKKFSFSAATTPRSVANQAGVQVYPEDKLTSRVSDSFLKEGAIGRQVVIDRATPANLNVYGTQLSVRTHAKTVAELLKEKNVVLAKDDVVQPAPSTPVTPATQIFVTRNGTKIVTSEEEIAMKIEYVEDPSLSFGSQAVRQKGSAGKRVVTYEVVLQNDKEIARKQIQVVTAQEPVTQIVARGKAVNIPADKEAVMAAAGIATSDYPYVNYIISRESGWNAAARNARSGATGLCQALPGSKMASAGADWATNPVTQLRWCDGYAKGRYGSWSAAYNFWLAQHYW